MAIKCENIVPGSIRASVSGIDLNVKERWRYLWANDGLRKFEVVGFKVTGNCSTTTEIVQIKYIIYKLA